MDNEEITNLLYDEDIAKAVEEFKKILFSVKMLYYLAGILILLLFFFVGAAIEHYYPLLLIHLW